MPCTTEFWGPSVKMSTVNKPRSTPVEPAQPQEDPYTWTVADADDAAEVGYRLYESSKYGLKIKRIKDDSDCGCDTFDTDTAAFTYVALMALKGDALAKKALNILADAHGVYTD